MEPGLASIQEVGLAPGDECVAFTFGFLLVVLELALRELTAAPASIGDTLDGFSEKDPGLEKVAPMFKL